MVTPTPLTRAILALVLLFVCATCSSPRVSDADDAGEDATPRIVDDDAAFGAVDAADVDHGLCRKCSGDMHSIVDCQDQVVTTCPPDEGCAGGLCVPACQAAEAGQTTVGCDYFAVHPPNMTQTCFAAIVANTWNAPVTITADWNGTAISTSSYAYVPQGSGASLTYKALTGALGPGEVAILFLADDTLTCPKKAALTGTAINGTEIGKAFHIKTSAPVAAYDIFPYGGGSSAVASATLLIPTSAWGDNYMTTTAYSIPGWWSWMAIVAQDNGTEVTISATADIVAGGGVSAASKGVPHKYTLQRGEVIKFDQPDDLTGSPVQSNKPIGVWGGNRCTFFPASVQACDGMHQQIPPIKALGNEYAAVRHRDRYPSNPETASWRFVGAVDGTTLTYDPPQATAPKTLKSGELFIHEAAKPFSVRSQDNSHPFYLGQYMTGCTAWWDGHDCRGDPEWVNVIAPAQYRSSYVFFTDPTYPTSHLVFVRAKAADTKFKDVNLDCAGALKGWTAVGSNGAYEYTRFDLIHDNYVKTGSCDNGRHEANSDGPFAVTVWGWGQEGTIGYSQACSYAYPAGAGVKSINSVVVPPAPK